MPTSPRPPRRRRWTLKIAAGALIAIASSASTALVVARLERSPPEPTPATATVLEAEADTEARGLDEQVPAPSTPEASAAARPPWTRSSGYAPQSSNGQALFNEATPVAAPLDRGFITCWFVSYGTADMVAGDDLKVNAVFGRAPEITVNGPEDGSVAFVSAPLVTLKHGDGLRFEVYDRDVLSDTLLSRTHPQFTGGAIEGLDQGARYVCRTFTPEAHARVVKTYDAVADGALIALRRRHLAPTDATWTYPRREAESARVAINDVAALTGWADARAVRRVNKLSIEETRLAGENATLFAHFYEGATDHATVGDLDVKLQTVDCQDALCTAHISAHNRTNEEKPLSSQGTLGVYVATAKGPVEADLDLVKLAPNATTTLDVRSKGVDLTKASALVGLCADHGCIALRTH